MRLPVIGRTVRFMIVLRVDVIFVMVHVIGFHCMHIIPLRSRTVRTVNAARRGRATHLPIPVVANPRRRTVYEFGAAVRRRGGLAFVAEASVAARIPDAVVHLRGGAGYVRVRGVADLIVGGEGWWGRGLSLTIISLTLIPQTIPSDV